MYQVLLPYIPRNVKLYEFYRHALVGRFFFIINKSHTFDFLSFAALTHFAQSSKMVTVTKGFETGLANRPFLVFDFRALWSSGLSALQSARKSKTKNGRLASPASNPWISNKIDDRQSDIVNVI